MSQSIRIRYDASVWRLPGSTPSGDSARAAVVAQGFAAQAWPRLHMQHRDDARLHSLGGATMGTSWSLKLANPGYAQLEPVQALVEGTLAEVIAQMSNWEPDSAITRFNRSAAGSWHELPVQFAEVLDAALQWARACGGAWDPALGALVSLWGFGPRPEPLAAHSGISPAQADIDQALAVSGHERLQWQPQSRRLRQPGGLQLDLSGIAKGFAVDWVAQRLQQAGWDGGLLEIGGELKAWGKRPDGRAWRVAVAGLAGDLQGAGRPLTVELGEGALATSGDHWHVFTEGGKRYSHTLDPRSGRPVAHALSSVTVCHTQCMHADALATVLTVLGPQAGWDFALARGLAAVFHEHEDAASQPALRRCTPAWQELHNTME
ncbi:FAD:protein FMN transferase [Comamonas composti]|uniref:FAD:protein FMN transferase n=1 Tax=Comamonas composti TaxID=408558 RepID=UPI000411C72C|nr:FAD:protein FMN transferase [Comamonas composti]